MRLRPASGIRASRQRHLALALACLAVLAGCSMSDPAHPSMALSVDGTRMKVYYAENVLDYLEVTDKDPATGEEIRITASPLTDGYAVARTDGQPTTEADKDRATQAAAHFCTREGGKPGALRLDSLQDSDAQVWFFGGCA